MKQISIEINTENEAFDRYPEMEVSRILRLIEEEFTLNSPHNMNLFDINGNKIGFVRVSD